MQLMPRSIFPFECVPLTRQDSLDSKSPQVSPIPSGFYPVKPHTHKMIIATGSHGHPIRLRPARRARASPSRHTPQHQSRHNYAKLQAFVCRPDIQRGFGGRNVHVGRGRERQGVYWTCEYVHMCFKIIKLSYCLIMLLKQDMDIPWHTFPLDTCPHVNVLWEYGVAFPMSMYFSVGEPDPMPSPLHKNEAQQPAHDGYTPADGLENDGGAKDTGQSKEGASGMDEKGLVTEDGDVVDPIPDEDAKVASQINEGDAEMEAEKGSQDLDGGADAGSQAEGGDEDEAQLAEFCRRLRGFGTAALYMNPTRHSMMLFAVDPHFDARGCEGYWHQQLPDPKRYGENEDWESCQMDGGPQWQPRVELVHEFTMLPQLDRMDASCMPSDGPCRKKRRGDDAGNAVPGNISVNKFWGGVSTGCSSVSDMQNRMVKLTGYGPLPYPRRAGVVFWGTTSEEDDGDTSKYRLGVIVAHRYGVHGCKHDGAAILDEEMRCQEELDEDQDESCDERDDDQEGTCAAPAAAAAEGRNCPHSYPHEDLRCYFCVQHPFFRVLFYNPCAPYGQSKCSASLHCNHPNSHSQDGNCWRTVPVTGPRVAFSTLKVGSKMLMTLETLELVIPSLKLQVRVVG